MTLDTIGFTHYSLVVSKKMCFVFCNELNLEMLKSNGYAKQSLYPSPWFEFENLGLYHSSANDKTNPPKNTANLT